MEKDQHNGQAAQQIPADMLVMMIGEQVVEIRVLRAQLAQAHAALVAANARIGEMGKELAECQEKLWRPCSADGGLGGLSGLGGLGGPEHSDIAGEMVANDEGVFPDCAGVKYD